MNRRSFFTKLLAAIPGVGLLKNGLHFPPVGHYWWTSDQLSQCYDPAYLRALGLTWKANRIRSPFTQTTFLEWSSQFPDSPSYKQHE